MKAVGLLVARAVEEAGCWDFCLGREREGRRQRWTVASAIGDVAAVTLCVVLCAAVLAVADGVARALCLATATMQQGRALCCSLGCPGCSGAVLGAAVQVAGDT